MLDINKIKELLEKEKIDELTVYLDEHKNEAADLLYAMGVLSYDRQDYNQTVQQPCGRKSEKTGNDKKRITSLTQVMLCSDVPSKQNGSIQNTKY